MELNEILQYIYVGSTNSITISRELSSNYVGYVIDITICKDMHLKIEFNFYGHEYGGLEFELTYLNYEDLVYCLEKHLQKKITEWDNINKTGFYPILDATFDISESTNLLISDFLSGNLKFPGGFISLVLKSDSWKEKINSFILKK